MRCAPTSSSMRAAERLKLKASRAASSLPLTFDPRRKVARAEILDAGLQTLQPPGQAAPNG